MSKITKAMILELSEAIDPQHQGECWPDPVEWDGRPLEVQARDTIALAQSIIDGAEGRFGKIDVKRVRRAIDAIPIQRVAYVFEDVGGWYINALEAIDDLRALDCRGRAYPSKRAAIAAAHNSHRCYTHYQIGDRKPRRFRGRE